MSIIQGNAHTSAGGGGYNIERSLRFNSADSAYLNRTPASAGNRRIFTLNQWVKRAQLGTRQVLFSAGTGANAGHEIEFQSDNTLAIYSNAPGASVALATTQVFRDPSAWGMLTFAFDTTQATASNRLKVYWNGVQITVFASSDYPAQNADMEFNNNVPHNIGRREISTTFYCGLYLTEIYFIDGQALTPSDFGETDSATGVWKPKAYSGTYGTNGFYLKFADNSGTTSTTLGKDSSGNGNNWTPNNFSVTAGVGNDSLVDSPTAYGTDTGVGGSVRGNYCTMNPLNALGFASGAITNGNLDVGNGNGTVYAGITSTMRVPTSVPIYAEFTILQTGTTGPRIGITSNNTIGNSSSVTFGNSASDWVLLTSNGDKRNNSSSSSYGSGFSVNDVGMIAVDTANGKVWFGKNGTWFNSGAPASGTNAAFTNVSGEVYFGEENDSDDKAAWNFGQRAFAYTAPSGFKALCTTNLPTPTIGATSTTQANKYFDINLWTGTGSAQSLVNSGGFRPDFVWGKIRSGADYHVLSNAIAGADKFLKSNTTDSEITNAQTITSFNSNGFSVGTSTDLNRNTYTFVGWQWNAGGSTVTNTSGTISAQVRANTTSGFSIATFTTPSSFTNATVGHGLGVAPSMIIVKRRTTGDWITWHTSLGTNGYVTLNTTSASSSNSGSFNGTSSTTWTLGSNAWWQASASDWVAYCFAPVAGYSAFGSYTGNGSTDGTFVYTGFRPRFIMIKRTDTTSNWVVWDTARDTYNAGGLGLYPNLSAAEDDYRSSNPDDILSNGFKPRANYANVNASGGTYVYAAFAETPFKYALAR